MKFIQKHISSIKKIMRTKLNMDKMYKEVIDAASATLFN